MAQRSARRSVAAAPPVGTGRCEIVTRLRSAGCVFAEEEADLLLATANSSDELTALVERRVNGEPLEVALGWAEFFGMRIHIVRGVFVPRKRSEFLVRQAAALAPPGAVVVDLCCGTGAIGAALLRALDTAELHVADIDPDALRCARMNLADVGAHVHLGDLYDALPATLRGRVDVLVVNAPYVPTDAIELMPPEARDHEPRPALDGGPDGVDVHRRVAAGAAQWLAPGGHLLIETGEEQAPRTVEALTSRGLSARVAHCTELGATAVIGTAEA